MGYVVKGLGETLKWDTAKSGSLFRSLRDDKPLAVHASRPAAVLVDVSPQQIRVQVENGTPADGLGGAWTRRWRGPASGRPGPRRWRPTAR